MLIINGKRFENQKAYMYYKEFTDLHHIEVKAPKEMVFKEDVMLKCLDDYYLKVYNVHYKDINRFMVRF